MSSGLIVQTASADPAPSPGAVSRTTAGALASGTIPDGTCSVNARAIGAGGATSTASGQSGGRGGSGASISASFAAFPGQSYGATAGGGGTLTAGGSGDAAGGAGGAGGTIVTVHRGGGGGGRSSISLAGTTVIVAGAGGGGSAAHANAPVGAGGVGGSAGIAPGAVVVGGDGVDGVDGANTVKGGQAGQVAAGGIGGDNSGSSTADGEAGGGIGDGNGGVGGADPSADSAGGGGGGYTGGGGGASTVASTVAGAGGGGGSSFLAASSPDVAGTAPWAIVGVDGPATSTAAGSGPSGSVRIDFVPCRYDLEVAKSVVASPANAGTKVTWTVSVKNNGPDAMTRGDIVTLNDTLPTGPNAAVSPAFKVTSVSTSGGSHADLDSAPIVCSGVAVGSSMPATTNCSRPYAGPNLPETPTGGDRGLNVGETITITYEQVIASTAPCATITNSASVVERASLSGTTDIVGVDTTDIAATNLVVDCYNLAVAQTANTASAFPGQTITWTIVVNNTTNVDMQGPDDPATNALSIATGFPAGAGPVTLVSASGPAGSCTMAGTTVTCANGLPANGQQTLTFTQTIPASTPSGAALTSTPSVADPVTGDSDDSASTTVTVNNPPPPVANNDAATTTANTAFSASTVMSNDTGTGLSVTAFTQPANGTVTMNPDGTYTYTPKPGFSGNDPFTYTITDALGREKTATVIVTVLPDAKPDSGSTPANTPFSGASVLANDIGTGLSVTANTQPAHGSVTMQPDGTYVYIPLPDYSGPDSFTYTITDANGKTATTVVNLTVRPIAPNDAATTPANTPVTAPSVLSNDSGTGLTVTSNTQPTNGTVTMKPDGTHTYTPNPSFSGVDTFTYTTTDAAGASTTATVTISVTPTSSPNSGTTNANTPLNGPSVLANDAGTGLTVVANSNPTSGTVVMNADGTYVYTPSQGFSGPVTFSYTAKDAAGLTTTSTVSITVMPTASNDTASTIAGQPVSASVLSNDNGSGLKVTANTAPKNGTVTMKPDGTYTYVPAPGFSGTDSFTYTVTDAAGNASTATVAIQVAPVASPDSGTTPANAPLNGSSVLANDVGAGLKVTANTQPANGTVSMNPDGTYVYTPNPGFSGNDTFSYTATDATGKTTSATVSISVTPLSAPDRATTPVNKTLSGSSVFANDSGTLTIAAHGQPSHGTVTMKADGTYTYVPNKGYIGTDSFVYYARDAAGNVVSNVVTITIVPPSNEPSASPDAGATPAGIPFNGPSVFANDSAEELQLTEHTQPTNGTVVLNADGTYVYTPNAGFSGTDTFTYTIRDAAGRTKTATVTIEVSPAPMIVRVPEVPAPSEPAVIVVEPNPSTVAPAPTPAPVAPATDAPAPAPTPTPAAPPATDAPAPAPAPEAPQGPGRVVGTLWVDMDGDGKKSESEPLRNVKVTLTCNGVPVAQTITNPEYEFVNVPVGNCVVEIDESSIPEPARSRLASARIPVRVLGEEVVRLDTAIDLAPSALAFTGSRTRSTGIIGVALIGSGLLFALWARPRRRQRA